MFWATHLPQLKTPVVVEAELQPGRLRRGMRSVLLAFVSGWDDPIFQRVDVEHHT